MTNPSNPPAEHDLMPDTEIQPLEALKVWDLPVRVMHWTLVTSVVVLTVTGLYIADPFIIGGTGPATGFTMGMIRAVHLATGWVFTTVLLARVAWAFRGNPWARWDQFIPIHRHRRKLFRPTVGYYLYTRTEPPPVIGHNPLAALTYVVLFLMFGFQAFTGFALQSLNNPDSTTAFLTKWVFVYATIPEVRLWHYLVMWLTWGFAIHHVYSAWLLDREERCGELSSMFTGWKSMPPHRLDIAPELKDRKPELKDRKSHDSSTRRRKVERDDARPDTAATDPGARAGQPAAERRRRWRPRRRATSDDRP